MTSTRNDVPLNEEEMRREIQRHLETVGMAICTLPLSRPTVDSTGLMRPGRVAGYTVGMTARELPELYAVDATTPQVRATLWHVGEYARTHGITAGQQVEVEGVRWRVTVLRAVQHVYFAREWYGDQLQVMRLVRVS
jgi:hypothetical protein